MLCPPCCLPACSIQALLSAPNPDDPLAEAIAKHWKENEPEAIGTGERSAAAGSVHMGMGEPRGV